MMSLSQASVVKGAIEKKGKANWFFKIWCVAFGVMFVALGVLVTSS